MNYIDEMKSNWQRYFFVNQNKYFFISVFAVISIVLFIFKYFLQFIERREGFVFIDPFLKLFQPIDLTWLIFGMIYGGLVLAIISLIKSPQIFSLAILTYTLMLIFRIIAMYFLPLNPPETMIALKDPFVECFGGGKTLTKDLFFSGHTATSFILFLTATNKYIKTTFLFLTIIMGISVLLMHVHYFVDVFIAPFVSVVSFLIAKSIFHKFEKFF